MTTCLQAVLHVMICLEKVMTFLQDIRKIAGRIFFWISCWSLKQFWDKCKYLTVLLVAMQKHYNYTNQMGIDKLSLPWTLIKAISDEKCLFFRSYYDYYQHWRVFYGASSSFNPNLLFPLFEWMPRVSRDEIINNKRQQSTSSFCLSYPIFASTQNSKEFFIVHRLVEA